MMMYRECAAPVLALYMVSYGSAHAETSQDSVEHVLQAYEDAWSQLDAHAVAGFHYEPALRVGRAGPAVRATRTEQEAFFTSFLAGLAAKGYAHSEWEQLEVQQLDSRTAIASGVTARYRSDGALLERVAVTYGLWHTEQGWKIFMSATHAPDTALQFR